MDGENNGSKPYFLMDDLGVQYHYFWKQPCPKLDGLKFGRCISGFKHGAILHIHFVKISGGGGILVGLQEAANHE